MCVHGCFIHIFASSTLQQLFTILASHRSPKTGGLLELSPSYSAVQSQGHYLNCAHRHLKRSRQWISKVHPSPFAFFFCEQGDWPMSILLCQVARFLAGNHCCLLQLGTERGLLQHSISNSWNRGEHLLSAVFNTSSLTLGAGNLKAVLFLFALNIFLRTVHCQNCFFALSPRNHWGDKLDWLQPWRWMQAVNIWYLFHFVSAIWHPQMQSMHYWNYMFWVLIFVPSPLSIGMFVLPPR